MRTAKQDATDLFTLMHDGTPVLLAEEGNTLKLEMEITYLANVLKSGGESILIVLHGVELVSFERWSDDRVLKDPKEIFALPLAILGPQPWGDDGIKVACALPAVGTQDGGYLYLRFGGFELFTQQGEAITLDELKSAAGAYWTEFENQD